MILKNIVMAYPFHDNKILLGRHIKSNRLLSIGGKVRPGETMEEALKREIQEELSLSIKILDYKPSLQIEREQPNPFLITTKYEKDYKLQIFEYICLIDDFSQLKVNTREIKEIKFFDKYSYKTTSELDNRQKLILAKVFEYFSHYKIR